MERIVKGSEQFCPDEFWNSSKAWPRSDFPVLTECFENTVLVYLPTIVIFLISLHHFTRNRAKYKTSYQCSLLHFSKLFTEVCLICALMIKLCYNVAEIRSISNVVASFLEVIDVGLAILILVYQRRSGYCSSVALTCFWTIYGICSFPLFFRLITQPTTKRAISSLNIVEIISFVFLCLSLLLSLFAEKQTIIEKQDHHDEYSPISKIFMAWMYPYIRHGYKTTISVNDLKTPPSDILAGRSLTQDAVNLLSAGDDDKIAKPVNLLKLVFRLLYKDFLFGLFLTVCHVIMRLILTALILSEIIIHMQDLESGVWKGYFLAAAILVNFVIADLCLYHGFAILGNVALQIKCVSIDLVYRKMFRLKSTDQRGASLGSLTNMVTIDSEQCVTLFIYMGMGISMPLVTVIITYMLYSLIGYGAIAGVLVSLIIIPLISYVSSVARTYQRLHTVYKDDRLRALSETLNAMKIIKLCGWENAFKDHIEQAKSLENKNMKLFAFWISVNRTVAMSAPLYISFVAFLVYVYAYNILDLDTRSIFVSLTLIYSLRLVFISVPETYAWCNQTYISMKRIENFINLPEIKRPEQIEDKHTDNAIEVAHLDAKYDSKDKNYVLKDVSLTAKRGELIAIVGRVGSGKTSLLQAILGELETEKGTAKVQGTIAYVPQTAWIRNATIRENIIFVKPYENQKYDNVITQCCLVPDLAILKNGDDTSIGEKGTRLSGGQKQRVSIARAVYQGADVYLFDDPLSALDSHVGVDIFDNIIGPTGLLSNKTRVLVTNNLSVLPAVDYIYLLEQGKVVSSGTYQELIDQQNDFSKLLSENIRNKMSEKKTDDEKNESNESKEIKDNVSEKEYMAKGIISLKVLRQYVSYFGYKMIFLMLIGTGGARVLELFCTYWLKLWTSGASGISNEAALGTYGGLAVVEAIGIFVGCLATIIGCLNAGGRFHASMLMSVLRSPMRFFDDTPSGRILNRFGNDIEQLDVRISAMLARIMDYFFQITGLLIFISIYFPSFIIVSVILLAFFVVVQRVNMGLGRQIKRLEAVARSNTCNHLSETLHGLVSIRAYRVERTFKQQYEHHVNANITCMYNLNMAQNCIMCLLAVIGDLVCFIVTMLLMLLHGTVDASTAAMLITNMIGSITAFSLWIKFSTDMESCLVSVERAAEFSQLPPEAEWTIATHTPDVGWPERGEIRYSDYATQYKSTHDLVLKSIDLHIKAGEKVGIVGRTGAGKSSFALTLFRVLEPTNGNIIIDDIDVTSIGLHDLRTRLTIIPQDPILFNGTLRFNLDPNGKYDDNLLWLSLNGAHLKGVFEKGGLDTQIDEGGSNLSAGQRQLVCLARAILRKRKILVMDEATASVDLETDLLIQDTIRNDFWNCTIITIAHRIKTILDYDTVVVLDHGQIIETGSPKQLLENVNSEFFSLAADAGVTQIIEENSKL